MPSNANKHPKDETLLVTVADSIGSTLGAIAAEASAVSVSLADSSFLQTAEREGRKIVRKGKTVARRIKVCFKKCQEQQARQSNTSAGCATQPPVRRDPFALFLSKRLLQGE